jgi:hypothetical protein
MRTKVLLGAAAALMLMISLVAIGSNMGFKISIPLTTGWANYVSLPYYNSYTNDNAMFSDITACAAVSRWNNATGAWQNYLGGAVSRFNITAGEGYVITVNSTTAWTPAHY